MRARAALLRLLAGLSIVFGVFFTSFFIAITLRYSGEASDLPNPPDALAQADETSVEVLHDIMSANANLVPTTAAPDTTEPTDTAPPETQLPETQLPEPLPLPELDPAFDSILAELGDTLAIPARLPAQLDGEPSQWASSIGRVDPDGYVINLDRDDNRVSTFTARRSRQLTPQLPTGTPVPLPNGLTGVLSDSSCGTGCNNPFITWIEDGVRYSVGSRVTSGAEVLDLAWRSIDSALPTPTGPEICGFGAPKHAGQVARTITTAVDDGRSMHWVAVCSNLGTDVEIIDAPGELRWQDIDANGIHDAVVRYDDGSATIFTIDNNRPRSVIDAGTGGRLLVADLRCSTSTTGRIAVDAASSERLDFVTSSTARRIDDESISEMTLGDC